ncbi:MAG: hypothetical protein ABMB14_34890, partial [Myxococcota bacterium]
WLAGVGGCGECFGVGDCATWDQMIATYDAQIADLIAAGDGQCAAVEDCRSIGVGAKACGGPTGYLPYCATAVDEAALEDTVADQIAAWKARNEETHAVSDCSVPAEPTLTLVDGTCTAD